MSDTKRRILVIIVLFLIVLFGVGQFFAFSNLNSNSSTPSGSNQNPLATQVISYVPETPTTSTPVVAGTCFANSAAAPYRSDAWRCTVGNQISDPCFEIPGVTGSLYCGANPTTTDTSSTFVLKLAMLSRVRRMPRGLSNSTMERLVDRLRGLCRSARPATLRIMLAMAARPERI